MRPSLLLIIGIACSPLSAFTAEKQIFRCESEGRITYSDTACGNVATKEAIEVGPLNSFTATTVTRPSKRQSPPTAKSSSIAEAQQRAKERCAKLDVRLDAIQTKLRRGYSVEEGNRLRDQRRQIEAQKRAQKCR